MGAKEQLKRMVYTQSLISRKNSALAIIVLSIDPFVLYLPGDSTDTTAVWETLNSISKEDMGK